MKLGDCVNECRVRLVGLGCAEQEMHYAPPWGWGWGNGLIRAVCSHLRADMYRISVLLRRKVSGTVVVIVEPPAVAILRFRV